MNRVQRALALLSPLMITAALSGCGTGAGPSASPSPSGTASPSTSESSASPSTTASTTPSTTASTGTATSSGGAPSTPAASDGVARCLSAQLEGSIQPGAGGAAGTYYAKIALKNVSASPCLLEGFAGVSLTAGPDGAPIGAPADRDTSTPVVPIVLQPGQSGAAEFGLHQARNYTGCTVVDAAGYRVYPPEDYGSLFIPAPATAACSNADIHLLTLRAFQPA